TPRRKILLKGVYSLSPDCLLRPWWPSGKVSTLGPEGSKPDSIEDPSCIGPAAR
ncbi:hypothetical protein AVEN_177945-1, partial [Araneus ventricosus]